MKAEPWEGVLNATKPGSRCIQSSTESKEMVVSEDCLNLNIYTPQVRVRIGKLFKIKNAMFEGTQIVFTSI